MADDFNIPPFAASDFDRRTFLDALLAVGFVSTAAAIAYPVARLSRAAGERRAGDADGGRRPRRALGLNTAAIFKFGSKPGIVVRTAEGEVRAFSAVCTHLDCTVQFKTDTSQLWCACHNGTYDLGGNVVSGPPPRGLEQFVVNLRGEGGDDEIVVSRGVRWHAEPGRLARRAARPERRAPFHRREGRAGPRQKIWYYLGGMTLFLFGVQIFTGILLLLYYRPSASEAYESVQFIVTQVQFGWLIRNIHSWSANLLIGLAFAHFFSVFFLKSYRKPRELTWVSGILLLFLMLGFGFSGYLLPWNELSFFATKVGTASPARCRSSAGSCCGCCAAATTSPARRCRGSTACTSPSCRCSRRRWSRCICCSCSGRDERAAVHRAQAEAG